MQGGGFVRKGISQLPGVAPTGYACLLEVDGDGAVVPSEPSGDSPDGCSQLAGIDQLSYLLWAHHQMVKGAG